MTIVATAVKMSKIVLEYQRNKGNLFSNTKPYFSHGVQTNFKNLEGADKNYCISIT